MSDSVGSIVFDRAADFYDETRGFPPGQEQPIAALIARAGGLGASSRVLEVGVGTGRIALPLAPHLGLLCGLDLSRAMMRRLREKQQSERIRLTEGDATLLPYPAHAFDAVVVVHVLHLIPNWQVALREIARVLKPGAPLLLGDGSSRDARTAFSVLWEAWEAALPVTQRAQVGLPRDHHSHLVGQGWQPLGERHTHAFSHAQTPQTFVDRLKRRVWSATWKLTDEELAVGIAAVNEAIAQHFGDPTQPVESDLRFEVQAYLPPPNPS